MERKVQRIKGSYQIVIPKQFAEMIGIRPGCMMKIEYTNSKIIMTPVTSKVLQDPDVTGAEATTLRGGHV